MCIHVCPVGRATALPFSVCIWWCGGFISERPDTPQTDPSALSQQQSIAFWTQVEHV